MVKRLIDVAGAAILLLITSPVSALVALMVRRNLGPPILFRQPRPGRDAVVFELVKFRSMETLEAGSEEGSDESRLSDFGRRLRATSMDELPTLWNVLRGDMSLVGPRPLLVEYLPLYTPEQARRHEVRPGVTGLAQVSGRNALSWEKKFALDVEYVERRGLRLDIAILLRTLGRVLARDGVVDEGGVSMSRFLGHGSAGEQRRPGHA
ncbi:sugar transferase [Nocardioides sp. CFH 31398]|nr:sugar transferase [Nocardioides sp. CFH 31398]